MPSSEEQILKAMKQAGKPVKAGEIAEILGMDAAEITKIFNKMKKDGQIISPKRCYYSPVE